MSPTAQNRVNGDWSTSKSATPTNLDGLWRDLRHDVFSTPCAEIGTLLDSVSKLSMKRRSGENKETKNLCFWCMVFSLFQYLRSCPRVSQGFPLIFSRFSLVLRRVPQVVPSSSRSSPGFLGFSKNFLGFPQLSQDFHMFSSAFPGVPQSFLRFSRSSTGFPRPSQEFPRHSLAFPRVPQVFLSFAKSFTQ